MADKKPVPSPAEATEKLYDEATFKWCTDPEHVDWTKPYSSKDDDKPCKPCFLAALTVQREALPDGHVCRTKVRVTTRPVPEYSEGNYD